MTTDAELFEEITNRSGAFLTSPATLTRLEEERQSDARQARTAVEEAAARRDAVVYQCAKFGHRVRYDRWDAAIGRTVRSCAICEAMLDVF